MSAFYRLSFRWHHVLISLVATISRASGRLPILLTTRPHFPNTRRVPYRRRRTCWSGSISTLRSPPYVKCSLFNVFVLQMQTLVNIPSEGSFLMRTVAYHPSQLLCISLYVCIPKIAIYFILLLSIFVRKFYHLIGPWLEEICWPTAGIGEIIGREISITDQIKTDAVRTCWRLRSETLFIPRSDDGPERNISYITISETLVRSYPSDFPLGFNASALQYVSM